MQKCDSLYGTFTCHSLSYSVKVWLLTRNIIFCWPLTIGRYRIALNFGGAKLWQIRLHKNFEVLNFGETSIKWINVHNLENFGRLHLAMERQFAKVWHHQSLALYCILEFFQVLWVEKPYKFSMLQLLVAGRGYVYNSSWSWQLVLTPIQVTDWFNCVELLLSQYPYSTV